jgi:hypothetical protein
MKQKHIAVVYVAENDWIKIDVYNASTWSTMVQAKKNEK